MSQPPSVKDSPTVQELFSLQGRVAVITGGCGYLGPVLAGALAEAGAHVALVDLDQRACDAVAARIASHTGVESLGVAADVTSPQAIERAVDQIVTRFGRLDVLVTAVYGKVKNFYAPFESWSLSDWDRMLAVNLTGTFLCCQRFGQYMAEHGGGSIVNIASHYGVVPPDPSVYEGANLSEVYVGASQVGRAMSPAAYSVSKAGILMLTRYLAVYWAGRGVRVNAMSPGGVFHPKENETFLKRYAARTPLGRKAWPHEVKGAVIFLASEAASYVTGQNLIVDGGWTVW